ncbi:MAG: single-stranded-DNA-specific exonuclease RecJ [Agathobacter sp.]|nr:single-stranded-DNA-specific exonuclease RecJ [Agathobacter sp.]MBQ2282724.1 single-stranded-DNA-specific exonuclease RecJ [Agathobacter sp.]
MKQWMVLSKKADFKAIGERFGIDQVTARIIRNRDIIEEEEIRDFLTGGLKELKDPHLLHEADVLVDILVEKIKTQKHIRILGDYDIDGVMSTHILKTALKRCQGNVSIQIPDRMKDGYGLNMNLVERAYQEGVDTILTCDNGIAAMEEIARGKELGMTILVTDHHEIPFVEEEGKRTYLRSKADAIVNPHQKECAYPYKNLCGAGVAWKVICLLYEKMGIPQKEAEDLLEFVAFATVGDIMSLTGENRILVKEGIKRIHHTENTGMKALILRCGLEPEQIDAYHFGFVLGPCVNASGRLDTAQRALELFSEEDPEIAGKVAEELVVLNEERKEMTLAGVERAVEICDQEDYGKDSVLVIYLPEVHESIAGIIAGKIRERYYKPTFILTKGEEGVKGSGRSIEEYSMYEEMCKCRELFTKFGGHPMAAGLSLPEENVEVFRRKINEYSPFKKTFPVEKIRIDVPMPLDYVSMDLIRELNLLAPFGKDNPHPIFADRDLTITRLWLIGKNQNVLRMNLVTASGMTVSGIAFRNVEAIQEYLQKKFGAAEYQAALQGRGSRMKISAIYTPKINCYRDVESIQFEIQEIQ